MLPYISSKRTSLLVRTSSTSAEPPTGPRISRQSIDTESRANKPAKQLWTPGSAKLQPACCSLWSPTGCQAWRSKPLRPRFESGPCRVCGQALKTMGGGNIPLHGQSKPWNGRKKTDNDRGVGWQTKFNLELSSSSLQISCKAFADDGWSAAPVSRPGGEILSYETDREMQSGCTPCTVISLQSEALLLQWMDSIDCSHGRT
mmetsp:Transcript_58487/g.115974  ORF Transcript_58487/g.115974 Transcript_58487/m.115974 type:complete len:202 (-) Transcript_58487:815-1420(-)